MDNAVGYGIMLLFFATGMLHIVSNISGDDKNADKCSVSKKGNDNKIHSRYGENGRNNTGHNKSNNGNQYANGFGVIVLDGHDSFSFMTMGTFPLCSLDIYNYTFVCYKSQGVNAE